jgi:CheY-like chemotaxis protein
VENSISHSNCSVLLAEDNKINQRLVQLILGRFNLELSIAGTGQEAVELAKSKHFDLILMDLHMPGMDGVEATLILKQELGPDCPPIVALTADARACDEARAMEQGLDGCLIKPINSEALRDCVEHHTGIVV